MISALSGLGSSIERVHDIYGLLTKGDRGQDGWILAKFFFACLWTETQSRSVNSQKMNEANIQQS